jgi:peptidyl-Lys metalloendopeptidase
MDWTWKRWMVAGVLSLAVGSSGCGGSAGDGQIGEAPSQEAQDEAATPAPAVSSGLSVTLSLPSGDGSGHVVRFELENRTAGPVHVFRDQTPLDGLTSRLFEVARDGVPVRYLGVEVSRAAADPASAPERFVVLGPGERLVADVDLADDYDLSAPGPYEVRFLKAPSAVVWELRQPGAEAASHPVFDANAPAAFLELSGVPLGTKPGAVTDVAGDGDADATVQGCSSAQATNLGTVQTLARQRAWNAYHYLDDHSDQATPTSPRTWTWTTRNTRYTWWYGYNLNHRANAYDNQLLEHWRHIARSLNGGYSDSPPPRFRCEPASDSTCRAGAYAYVYSSDATKTVHLCPPFWGENTNGRRNMVLHEVSHFDWANVGGAGDIVYGAPGSHNLPPHDRYYNADNFLFFAIDTTRT